MIHFKTGNMLAEDVKAMVNTVNCVGVMGQGIALQFKNAFPENYRAYAKACRRGEIGPGRMFVFETGALVYPHLIVNFPTKRHWRNSSRLEDIDAGLVDLARVIREHEVCSIAMPALGSGLGGLNWCEVRPRIELALRDFDGLDCIVFEPGEPADARR